MFGTTQNPTPYNRVQHVKPTVHTRNVFSAANEIFTSLFDEHVELITRNRYLTVCSLIVTAGNSTDEML